MGSDDRRLSRALARNRWRTTPAAPATAPEDRTVGPRHTQTKERGRASADHPTPSAKGRTGDRPGPLKETNEGRHVTKEHMQEQLGTCQIGLQLRAPLVDFILFTSECIPTWGGRGGRLGFGRALKEPPPSGSLRNALIEGVHSGTARTVHDKRDMRCVCFGFVRGNDPFSVHRSTKQQHHSQCSECGERASAFGSRALHLQTGQLYCNDTRLLADSFYCSVQNCAAPSP